MRKLAGLLLVLTVMAWVGGCLPLDPGLPPAVQWVLLYSDSFSNINSYGWYQGYGSDHEWWIEGGRYHAYLPNWDWYDYVYNEDRTYGLTDFHLKVDTIQEGFTSDHAWGVVFRAQGESFYAFEISEDGYMGFFRHSPEGWDDDYEWQPCTAIHETILTDHIEIIAEGPNFTCLVNGVEVLHVQDWAITSGSIGFIVDTWNDPYARVAFDNLEVWVKQ